MIATVLLVLTSCADGFAPRIGPRVVARRADARRNTALSMNMFERFQRVAKANINNMLNTMEDPEKVLGQAVEDLQKDLVSIRQSYAEVMATQKRMQRQKEQAEGLADEWFKRAQLALEKNDDELAREALSRKQQQVDAAGSLEGQIAIQSGSLSKLYDSMTQLESKITEARAMKDQYIARARTAKTATKVNDMLSNVGGTSSMDAFERMKEKVEMLESQAEVSSNLNLIGGTSSNMEERFKELEGTTAVDDELSQMKRSLMPTAEPLKALSPSESEAAIDDELSKLKNAAFTTTEP